MVFRVNMLWLDAFQVRVWGWVVLRVYILNLDGVSFLYFEAQWCFMFTF